jgi:probable HAF family extracellular repeat protein
MVLDVPGATSTTADGINNGSQIVGTFQDTSGVQHGVLWDNGTMTTFDVPGTLYTEAHGLNNQGQIVGAFLGATGNGNVLRGYVTTPVDSGPLARFGVQAVY